ncbi:hypothetical protein SCP_0309620 [Sparassis crispa]|uniref:Spindle pole body component n=1 Tax=Sparassis crispa TaxID=139825 RepID=A0A401GGH6_9APHY|nr:hypothetical protein SCP_0309620 [Sparassis crispa]GBE81235.1 hypothetical protein SCP_0309620 [Sparassis crispa]
MSLFSAFSAVESGHLTIESLPDLPPHFFVPKLLDKPQNPIMDTLKLRESLHKSPPALHTIPKELEVLTLDTLNAQVELPDQLWGSSVVGRAARTNNLMSWDTLRHSGDPRMGRSAFLSQQPSHIFASARYHVRPPLQDPGIQLVYTTLHELIQSLRMSLTGTSSSLHVWDHQSETFILRGVNEGKKGIIVITGKDEVVSSSVIQRFLTIGTLMRRLETFVVHHRTSKSEPIVNAFTHSLSSILSYLHPLVSTLPAYLVPLDTDSIWDDVAPLTAVWIHYAEIEEVLQGLAALCHREEHVSPTAYIEFPTSPSDLLSLIYRHLNDHLEKHSPRLVLALFAYMLTMTSRDYFQQLCQSVGYSTVSAPAHHAMDLQQVDSNQLATGFLDEDNLDENPEDAFNDNDDDSVFPSFIERSISDSLLRARKSLRLLCVAQPDHPLLSGEVVHLDIEWFWTNEEVEAAWTEGAVRTSSSSSLASSDTLTDNEDVTHRPYPHGMEAFSIFDLQPGAHISQASTHSLLLDASHITNLQAFIAPFPRTLPALTPTLPHLTALVLTPLVAHIHSLSSTLVALYLTPATHLHLHTHLVLLRSYLLLTSHPFKSRLARALFSDSDEYEHVSEPARNTARWAVGLSPSLMDGDIWPPAGASLSFHLRTVIVDSLDFYRDDVFRDSGDAHGFKTLDGEQRVMEEAEYRLGFSIRDLPVGTGKDKWLDPLSIESLDFLYMDYNPPKSLDVLITQTILSKYHRMFAFNLRLMRVENVVAALYRMTRKPTEPLFPTLTPTNKLLLHFRFVAHAFVTSLSSYVFDTAIGGNFDMFLSQLSHTAHGFVDVFALADRHSRVLDDILGACLLRSGQKSVGDLLRGCMELVLDLGILAGERARGRLEEYEAAPLLEDLWASFSGKMMTLVKVLKALVEKGSGPSRVLAEDVRLQASPLFQVEGVTGNLRNLLVRLDVAEWWSHAYEKRRSGGRPT